VNETTTCRGSGLAEVKTRFLATVSSILCVFSENILMLLYTLTLTLKLFSKREYVKLNKRYSC
jgi:hypothetical protein